MTLFFDRILKRSLLAALLSSAALSAHAETLGNALISAYRNSHLVEQNRAVLRAADEGVAAAVSALRPVVSWILQSQYSKVPKPAGRDGTKSTSNLNFDWTVYDFGRSQIGVEIAKEQVLATRQALVGVEQNVMLSAIEAYMTLRQAEETVSINETSVQVIGEQLKAAQDRFDVGEITRTDVEQALSSLAASQATLAATQGSLAMARAYYKAAIGHEPDGKTRVPPAPKLPATLAEAQSIALRMHPSILQAQHQVKASDLEVQLAVAERRPSIGLNMNVSNSLDGDGTVDSATVQVSQPLYTGGLLSSTHRKAIANRDSSRALLSQTGVTVAQSVANAWAQIETSRVQISATEQQIVAAQAAYDGVVEEAKLGARTTLDVLNAEQVVLQAHSDNVTAQSNLQIAYYSLLSSMGLLTVDHLNLGISTYDVEGYYNAVKDAPLTSTRGKSLDRVLKAIGKN